ncbi:MAG: hypothetical protein D9C04_02405 [Nitrosopumilus sp. B06]|nr:MAG: hypothetical protein D9C04_02405 [Nitrosopumilus sp. B06]
MDAKKLLAELGMSGHPAGLGGCHVSGGHFEACAHDMVVFDGGSGSRLAESDGDTVMVWHASLSETRSGSLLGYDRLRIVCDESWELHMLLSRIEQRRKLLYADHARHCLVESLLCCQKSRQYPGVLASCWQKCASYYLADAICALNSCIPGSSHMLDALRSMQKAGRHIETVTKTVGTERATPTLLERISKSAVGLADMAGYISQTIEPKRDYFVKNSMPSDCYFYLCHSSRESFVNLMSSSGRKPELEYILKTAFDVESDSNLVMQHVKLVEKSCNELLGEPRN